jgi:hypothetical protein
MDPSVSRGLRLRRNSLARILRSDASITGLLSSGIA